MYNTKIIKSSPNRLKTVNFKMWLVFGFFSLLVLSTWQCASIQRPTGGPKDSIPPKILDEQPKNLTRNFDEKQITISFDEFIKLTNEYQEITMSPEMPSRPEFRVRRRDLVVTLPDSLEENSTYTINFGKAIQDVNESNELVNYTYVFSTGDIIDSLSVSGKVRNALTQEVEEGVTVMLIPTRQDSIFGKSRPNIFTQTDTSGNYQLNYLREETYRIYALKEDNNDRIYNAPSEYIGFLVDSIHLDTTLTNINLEIFRQIPDNFRNINRTIEQNGRITFVFNRPMKNGDIEILTPESLEADKIVEFVPSLDTATLWVNALDFDSLKVRFLEGNEVHDTVTMRRGRNDKYDRNFIITNNLDRNRVNRVNHLILKSASPVGAIDRNKLVLLEDSIPRTNYQLVPDTSAPRQYILRYNWRPQRNYELEIKEGAFQGYFGDINQPITFSFTLDDSDNHGDILFQIEVPDTTKQYILELVNDKKDQVFRRIVISENQDISFKQLRAGKYGLRIIYDENQNGEWDPGHVGQKRQSERIWYLNKEFIIRANWEQSDKITIPK